MAQSARNEYGSGKKKKTKKNCAAVQHGAGLGSYDMVLRRAWSEQRWVAI